MRNEHRKIGENQYMVLRCDRGAFDVVFDEENEGWYIETVIGGITMRTSTYPHAVAAEAALKNKDFALKTIENQVLEPK